MQGQPEGANLLVPANRPGQLEGILSLGLKIPLVTLKRGGSLAMTAYNRLTDQPTPQEKALRQSMDPLRYAIGITGPRNINASDPPNLLGLHRALETSHLVNWSQAVLAVYALATPYDSEEKIEEVSATAEFIADDFNRNRSRLRSSILPYAGIEPERRVIFTTDEASVELPGPAYEMMGDLIRGNMSKIRKDPPGLKEILPLSVLFVATQYASSIFALRSRRLSRDAVAVFTDTAKRPRDYRWHYEEIREVTQIPSAPSESTVSEEMPPLPADVKDNVPRNRFTRDGAQPQPEPADSNLQTEHAEV